MIRPVRIEDAGEIVNIYNYYITNSIATFEEIELTEDEMRGKIISITESFPWLLYEEEGRVVGYAYASKWRARSAYRYSTESSVYIRNGHNSRGIGSALYGKLLEILSGMEMKTIIAGISLPNDASRRLHEKLGFEKVAHFVQVGKKFEKWIDVGYWQLNLY